MRLITLENVVTIMHSDSISAFFLVVVVAAAAAVVVMVVPFRIPGSTSSPAW